MTSKGVGPSVIGIDLGGTKVVAGVVTADNRIVGRAKRATPAKEGARAIVLAIIECVEEALATAGMARGSIAAAGMGAPGPLDAPAGVILFSANLNVKNFPIGPEVASFLDRPVVVRNDVRVAGYAEFRLGAGRGYQDIVVVFVGTGIGGCLIHRGEIVKGLTGNAGEIGHMIIKAGGPRCGCGARGCMEALASKTAIARRVEKAVRKSTPTVLGEKMARKAGRLKSRDLADAFSANDAVALKEIQRAAHFLGVGLGNLINVFGPEIVIVGGGVVEAIGDAYVHMVGTAARAHVLTDPGGKVRIERASLGDDAGVLGAALLAREHLALS
jgi:glucokinase